MSTIIRKTEKLDQNQTALDLPRKDEPKKPPSIGHLSQWQLIGLRFRRHRLAVFSLFVLAILYITATFAEFFAPYSRDWRELNYMHAPPQLPKFNLQHGWYVDALMQDRDPITFQRRYVADPGRVVPLSFFVKGEPYQMWGIINWDRRLFGVDHRAVADWPAEAPPPAFYFLGADKYGHDLFSRILFGARISLSIGLIAIFLTFVLGIVIGGISGYKGGAIDDFIQRFIEIVNSFPQLPLWLALAAVMPADWSMMVMYLGITIVLSLLGWTGLARVVRGKILALREEDYAVAARLLGASHQRVLFRHLVPGFTSHIIVVLTLSVPAMILGETALSFLGLGLRPPVVSWGVMLQDTMQLQAVAKYPWLLLPVMPIIVTVLAFNFLGDGMRDAADPYASM